MKQSPLSEQEVNQMIIALSHVCSEGPYDFDFGKSTVHVQVWHCKACGAELRFGTTISIPTWTHYKPGYGPF